MRSGQCVSAEKQSYLPSSEEWQVVGAVSVSTTEMLQLIMSNKKVANYSQNDETHIAVRPENSNSKNGSHLPIAEVEVDTAALIIYAEKIIALLKANPSLFHRLPQACLSADAFIERYTDSQYNLVNLLSSRFRSQLSDDEFNKIKTEYSIFNDIGKGSYQHLKIRAEKVNDHGDKKIKDQIENHENRMETALVFSPSAKF